MIKQPVINNRRFKIAFQYKEKRERERGDVCHSISINLQQQSWVSYVVVTWDSLFSLLEDGSVSLFCLILELRANKNNALESK